MRKRLIWRHYHIWKNGKDTGRKVAIWYYDGDISQRDKKVKQLRADYPKDEGYALVFAREAIGMYVNA